MPNPTRKKLALITTIWGWRSHANHMGERFLNGYPLNGKWHRPEIEVVSAYVDQRSEGDLSRQRAQKHGFQIYPTIAETLRLGSDRMGVDAVLLIAEHGDYPTNQKGQKLYPRYEFFQQIVDVFRQDGTAVPVFNDKHLSYSFEKAQRMVLASKELQFPFLAGSSLPVTFRLPPLELPINCVLEDALMIGIGGSDAMDYHALEAMQCMVERRRGGETGVRAVQLIEGDEVWRAGRDSRWSRRLLEGALARSDSRSGIGLSDGRPQDLAHSGELEQLVENPSAYFIEYNDGWQATLLMLNGAVQDYHLCGQGSGSTRGAVDPVFAASDAQRDLFSLSDGQGGRDDRFRPGTVSSGADASGQRRTGALSPISPQRPSSAGNTRVERLLPGTGSIAFLRSA